MFLGLLGQVLLVLKLDEEREKSSLYQKIECEVVEWSCLLQEGCCFGNQCGCDGGEKAAGTSRLSKAFAALSSLEFRGL